MRTFLFLLAVGATLLCEGSVSACLRSRHPVRSVCRPGPQLTPEVARQAVLDLLLTQPGKPLDAFKPEIVEQMSRVGIEKREGGRYRWTGVCYLEPDKMSYTLYIPWGDRLGQYVRPDFNGLYLHVGVFEGTFELRGGRWVAAVPKYKYTLLD